MIHLVLIIEGYFIMMCFIHSPEIYHDFCKLLFSVRHDCLSALQVVKSSKTITVHNTISTSHCSKSFERGYMCLLNFSLTFKNGISYSLRLRLNCDDKFWSSRAFESSHECLFALQVARSGKNTLIQDNKNAP